MRGPVVLVAATSILLIGCGEEKTYGGGFDSAESCAEGHVFLTEGDVSVAELMSTCEVSEAVAQVALDKGPIEASERDAEPVASPTTAPPIVSETTAPPVEATAPMPDVVCMNLQDAQDEIQRHGTFFSRSRDATGQGRNQIIDSNWLVVDQDPPAGALIGEGDALLYVVKYGEPNACGL